MGDTVSGPLAPGREDDDLRSDDTFSISQLAAAFDVTTRAIRFYESKGLIAPLRRGRNRIYSRRDRARLTLILRGKRVGFSLDEIKDMLDLYDLRDGQETQLRHALTKCDERIAALEAQRKDIDDAIDALRTSKAAMLELLETKAAQPVQPCVTSFAIARDLPSQEADPEVVWERSGDDETHDGRPDFLAPDVFLVKDS